MAEISLAKKLIAGGSLGVALFVGGEVMHHQGANKTAATTLEWLGGSAAVLAGIGLGQQGLDILATAEYRRRKEELEALRNKVPLLLPAAASLELAIRKLRNLPEEDAEIFNPNSSSMQPLLAAYHNFPRSSQVA